MLNLSAVSQSYLLVQRGDLRKYDGSITGWMEHYIDVLQAELSQIKSVVSHPMRVLNIGSGLGGLDVLMIREWACHVTMIDGENAQPEVIRQDQPFGNRQATMDFMAENYIHPEFYSYHNPASAPMDRRYDLVISLGSWCFHYPPAQYLDYVKARSIKGASIVIDVRHERPWAAELKKNFDHVRTIVAHPNGKGSREVFRVR